LPVAAAALAGVRLLPAAAAAAEEEEATDATDPPVDGERADRGRAPLLLLPSLVVRPRRADADEDAEGERADRTVPVPTPTPVPPEPLPVGDAAAMLPRLSARRWVCSAGPDATVGVMGALVLPVGDEALAGTGRLGVTGACSSSGGGGSKTGDAGAAAAAWEGDGGAELAGVATAAGEPDAEPEPDAAAAAAAVSGWAGALRYDAAAPNELPTAATSVLEARGIALTAASCCGNAGGGGGGDTSGSRWCTSGPLLSAASRMNDADVTGTGGGARRAEAGVPGARCVACSRAPTLDSSRSTCRRDCSWSGPNCEANVAGDDRYRRTEGLPSDPPVSMAGKGAAVRVSRLEAATATAPRFASSGAWLPEASTSAARIQQMPCVQPSNPALQPRSRAKCGLDGPEALAQWRSGPRLRLACNAGTLHPHGHDHLMSTILMLR